MRELFFVGFLTTFVGFKMLNDWKPFTDFHDPYSFRSSLDFASVRYHCKTLHAAMFIFINFICAILLYIIYMYCIDYRFFSIGFSLYMASWHGYNLFAFRFFGSDEIFTFEYWPWFSGSKMHGEPSGCIVFPRFMHFLIARPCSCEFHFEKNLRLKNW